MLQGLSILTRSTFLHKWLSLINDNSIIPNSITKIENSMYVSNRFKKIIIHDDITEISDYAFAYCYNLTEVVFNNTSKLKNIGVGAFIGCYNLEKLTLPNSITEIGDYAFYRCINWRIEKLNLKNVAQIGKNTFMNAAPFINELILNKNLTEINQFFLTGSGSTGRNLASRSKINYIFGGNMELVNSNTDLGYLNSQIYSPHIAKPNLKKKITNRLIEILDLTDTFQFESELSFYNLKNVKTIILPKKLMAKSIHKRVTWDFWRRQFNNWNPLGLGTNPNNSEYKSNLSETINYISEGINSNSCLYSLKNIVINNGYNALLFFMGMRLNNVHSLEFPNVFINNITITDHCKILPDELFRDFYQIKKIYIPDSVHTIGNRLFLNCKNLTEVIIGNGVKDLGIDVFAGCYNLKTLVIGDSVNDLGLIERSWEGWKSNNLHTFGYNGPQYSHEKRYNSYEGYSTADRNNIEGYFKNHYIKANNEIIYCNGSAGAERNYMKRYMGSTSGYFFMDHAAITLGGTPNKYISKQKKIGRVTIRDDRMTERLEQKKKNYDYDSDSIMQLFNETDRQPTYKQITDYNPLSVDPYNLSGSSSISKCTNLEHIHIGNSIQ